MSHIRRMSRLSDCLQRTLDELQIPAAHLERSASLPAMALTHMRKGSHPRCDRFDRLLQAIPGLTHRVELVIAYTLDDTPESYREAVEAILRAHLYEWLHVATSEPTVTTLRESATATSRAISNATKARQVLADMGRRLDAGDTMLADWLADTGELLTAAHLPPEA